jgi:hypothetical protein
MPARTFALQEDYLTNHTHAHAANQYTKKDLMKVAAAREIVGRSKMDKPALIAALTQQEWGSEKPAKKTRSHTAWDDFRHEKLSEYISSQNGFAGAMARISKQWRESPAYKGPRVPKAKAPKEPKEPVVKGPPKAKGAYGKYVKEAVARYMAQQGAADKYGEGKEWKSKAARALAQYRASKA